MHRTFNMQRPRGFTLTELSIVLGILGLLMGAIWIAYQKVDANLKNSEAVSDILLISQNLRNFYKNGTIDVTGDVTPQWINANIIPASIVQPIVCKGANGAPGFNPCPFSPWTVSLNPGVAPVPIAITAGSQTGYGGAIPSNRDFEIVFWGLTTDECEPLMLAMVNSSSTNGLQWLYSDGIGGVNVTPGMNLTSAPINGCQGNIVFQFKL